MKVQKDMTSTLTIRKATVADLPVVMKLFDSARSIMRADGNMHQWTGGYPTEAIALHDIEQGHCYLCIGADGEVEGTFAFIPGPDPTYLHIYEGCWAETEQPYAVVHRLASSGRMHGVADACFDWAYNQVPNLRVDTHRDNRIMQRFLLSRGFVYCGIIYLLNGDERLAYQKCAGWQAGQI